MATDDAQFISELIISGPGSPQGTEDISEGDDQIRTCKRATQQSFPNVDAAVTATAAEMNDQPEKLVAETVGGAWTFAGDLTMNAIIAAVLDNAVALQGKEVDDVTIGDLITMNASDQVIVGNAVNDLFINALFNMVLQINSAKVMTLSTSFNNSDVPFRVQGTEMFGFTYTVTGSTTVDVTNRTANAGGITVARVSNTITVTHNFGHTDYMISFSGSRQDNTIVSGTKGANDFDMFQTSTGTTFDIMLMRNTP